MSDINFAIDRMLDKEEVNPVDYINDIFDDVFSDDENNNKTETEDFNSQQANCLFSILGNNLGNN